eukprot:52451_1
MSHQSSAESHDEVEEKSVLGKRTQLSPTSNQATPPPKRRRTTQWNQIFESRSTNNSKKKTKKKKKKSQLPKVSKSKEIKAVETKFMALPVNQKTLILNPSIQNDTSQFETMAGMCGNELNAEITSINEILIKVRLCSFNQGTRIHLKDKLITGEYVKRAPKLVSIFVNLISKLEDIKSEFIDKKQSIEDIFKNKKIKNIENRAEKMTVAKENDKKRHEERKKKEEKEFGGSTAGLNANESDDELRVEN